MRRFTVEEIEKMRLMASVGHSGKAIGNALGRTPQSVRVKACELGIRLRRPSLEARRFKVPRSTWLALQDEAAKLNTSPGRLARQLLEVVVRDGLVNAVIDPAPLTPRATATRPDVKWAAALAARAAQ